MLGADLDAGVAGIEFEVELEVEVGDVAALPDEEGVLFDGVFLGGFANDGAVFDAPEFGVTGPAEEVFAVENVGGGCGGSGFFFLSVLGGGGENGDADEAGDGKGEDGEAVWFHGFVKKVYG